MKLYELADSIAEDQRMPREFMRELLAETIRCVVESIERGEEIKLRGLGTFKWIEVSKSTPIQSPHGVNEQPKGWKLRFIPAVKLRNRRTSCPTKE